MEHEKCYDKINDRATAEADSNDVVDGNVPAVDTVGYNDVAGIVDPSYVIDVDVGRLVLLLLLLFLIILIQLLLLLLFI